MLLTAVRLPLIVASALIRGHLRRRSEPNPIPLCKKFHLRWPRLRRTPAEDDLAFEDRARPIGKGNWKKKQRRRPYAESLHLVRHLIHLFGIHRPGYSDGKNVTHRKPVERGDQDDHQGFQELRQQVTGRWTAVHQREIRTSCREQEERLRWCSWRPERSRNRMGQEK